MRHVLAIVPLAILLSLPTVRAGPELRDPLDEAQARELSVKLPTTKQSSPHVSFVVALTPIDSKPGGEVTVSIKGLIDPGWHIASVDQATDDAPSLSTAIEFHATSLAPIGMGFAPSTAPDPVETAGVTHYQHSGEVTWARRYRLTERAARPAGEALSGTGAITFQVCNDELCLPPTTLEFTLGRTAAPGGIKALHPRRSYKVIGEPIRIPLVDSTLQRKLIDYRSLVTADPNEDIHKYAQQLTKAMRATEALPLCGRFAIDGRTVSLYLADQDTYSLTNSTNDDTRYSNTATFVSIDHDGDGKILDYESVPVNRPIRILDSMFLVTKIEMSDSAITLQQIESPLAGAVLGRRCPEFWYETVEGQVVSNKSILGHVTILDVWAVT